MIVRHFLRWIQTAPAGDRADATAALARAYLHSDLTVEDRAAAEAAMMTLLDDPSPLVRRALADTLAVSADAPHAVLAGLLQDQPEIAALVARHSPILLDAELVDMVGGGEPLVQYAVAQREDLPAPVAAAIAEVGCLESCLALVALDFADIPAFSIDRIVERFGHDPDIREALFAREDLSPGARQALVVKLSAALTAFVTEKSWLPADRAGRIAREASEKAAVVIAARCDGGELFPLVRHLRLSGQLTAGLILRALLSGHVALFEEALAELSGLGLRRASGLIHDRRGAGFRVLYDKAGLPASAHAAFRAALEAWHEEGGLAGRRDARLSRRMVERVLTAYAPQAGSDLDQLLALLRRFVAEAARDEARAFTRDLIAGNEALDDEDLAFPLGAAA